MIAFTLFTKFHLLHFSFTTFPTPLMATLKIQLFTFERQYNDYIVSNGIKF